MRRRGFTLIELLVVIAIIGILAAMLFPVFARARESARKVQCLANVKNIAVGMNLYLTDWDAFPPPNVDEGARAYFMQGGGGGPAYCDPAAYSQGWWETNPYLKWPVVLDEYIKNRDVWRCPSSRMVNGARFIMPEYTAPWWEYLHQSEGKWGSASGSCCYGPCWGTYPTGWGGSVTDSIVQGATALGSGHDQTQSGERAFVQTIAYNADNLTGMNLSQMDDTSAYPICADSNWDANWFTWWAMAYGPRGYAESLFGVTGDDCDRFCTDPSFRRQFTPHMGGINVGFADGHAKWFTAEAAIRAGGDCRCCAPEMDYGSSYETPAEAWKGNCPRGSVWFGEPQN